MKPQAAYDFADGVLRIWVNHTVVATFPSTYFDNLAIELIKQRKARKGTHDD